MRDIKHEHEHLLTMKQDLNTHQINEIHDPRHNDLLFILLSFPLRPPHIHRRRHHRRYFHP